MSTLSHLRVVFCVALLAGFSSAQAASSWTLFADSSKGLPVVPAGSFINMPRMTVDAAHNCIYISSANTWKAGLGWAGTDNVCRIWKGDLTTGSFTLMPQTGLSAGKFSVYDMIINKNGEVVISGGWGTQGYTSGTGGDFFYFDVPTQTWVAANYVGSKPNLIVHNMSMAPNGTIWGAGRWHDVYKSTDNGRTFTDINPHNTIPAIMWPTQTGATDEGATYGIFYDPNTNCVFTGTETGGVIYSADDGAHWDCVDPHYHNNSGTSTINEGFLGNIWGFGLSKTNELIINGYPGTGAPSGNFGAIGQGMYHYNHTAKTDGVCAGFPAYLFNNQKYYDHIITTADGHNFFEIERTPDVDFVGQGGIYTSADGINWTAFNTGITFPSFGTGSYHYTYSEGALAVNGNDVYTATSDGKIYIYNTGGAATAPAITTQPANQTVAVGQTATFSVVASGMAPLTYQWKKNGTAISGATSATYTTPATVAGDNGATFAVVVTNSAGSATSNAATLTVTSVIAPSITTQPANQTVAIGQTATFSVVASGTAPLTYQWKKNGTAISGATSATYTTPATVAGDNGATFTVVVTNSAGSATSNAATLTVTSVTAPSITTQPANQSVTTGQTATFNVVASGTAPLTYQWKKNGTAISGATSASYTTPATVIGDNGATFTVVITNSAGSATSNAATLTVSAPSSTLYVDANNANASPNGTITNPYKTIQAAVAAASSGATIKVAKGAYTGNTDCDVKALNFFGGYAGGTTANYAASVAGDFTTRDIVNNVTSVTGTTTITGNDHGAVFHFTNTTGGTIDGFTLSGALHGVYFDGYLTGGTVFTISNNIIQNNGSQTEPMGGGIYGGHLSLAILNNTIQNNVAAKGAGVGCTSTTTGVSLLIQGNLIKSNISYSDHGGGLYVGQLATVKNNIVQSNEVGKSVGYGWGGGMIMTPANSGAPFPTAHNVISGNVWTDNYAPTNGSGFFVDEGAIADVDHDLVYKNRTNIANSGNGIYIGDYNYGGAGAHGSTVTFTNCLIANNGAGTGTANALQINPNCIVSLSNCILWGNGPTSIKLETGGSGTVTATYSDIEGGYTGTGNLNVDPQFASVATSDYHLKSTGGRWDPTANSGAGGFVNDAVDSPCIDSGDPISVYGNELAPNGSRINMGTEGNTAQASKSPGAAAPTITTQPANQTVIVGQTASFSVVASGTAPLTYQWKKNGSAISGATSASYTTPATVIGDNGATFSVVVTNSAGSATSNNATLTVNAAAVAPTITTQPANQTVTVGQTATFSVVASGTAPLTYQWKKNGTAISGATSASYTTPATVIGDNGALFSVVVTNSAGSATSNNATLTVNASSGPGVWTDFASPLPERPRPIAPIKVIGGNIFVAGQANGAYKSSLSSPAFTALSTGWTSKQMWRMGVNALGNPIGGAASTGTGLNSPPVLYWNGTTWTGSTFNPAPTPGNWWYGLTSGFTLDPTNGTIYTAGNFALMKSTDNGATFNQFFNLGTVCSSGGGYGYIYTFERMPWGELFVGGESDTFYHSTDDGVTWSAIPVITPGGNRYGCSYTKDGEVLLSTAGDTNGNMMLCYNAAGQFTPMMNGLSAWQFNQQLSYVVNIPYTDSGENYAAAVFADNTMHVIRWDGSTWTTIEALPNGPNQTLVMNSIGTDGSNIYVGTSAMQIKKWTPTAKLPFTVNLAGPLTLPTSGGSVSGSMSTAGSYTYTWTARGAGTVTFGSPNALTSTVTFSQLGDYVLNLKASNGTVSAGNSVIVHVTSGGPVAPTITTQPANQTVSVGQTATFSVVASGTAPLTYQWKKNGTAISGATSASYTTPATVIGDNGALFSVVVTNAAGSATSNNATLTVNAAAVAPTITTQPANQTVSVGQTATFSVVASGTAPLTYQWKKNGIAISGATSATYTTPATVIGDNGALFSVVVTNSASSATSNNATLTVNAAAVAPTITTQPANQTVTVGQTATFSVVASGTAPLTYQWKKNGTAISGATSASYTTPATVIGDNGALFSVVVTNAAGSATSNNATLTVNAAAVAPTITTQPANQTVTIGQTATFSVVASGTAPLTYQWKKNGTAISGATSASYTTPATVIGDNGALFSVVVTNAAGSVTSNNATLTVTAAGTAPTITALSPKSGGTGPWASYVSITGTNFATTGTVTVTFGGIAAPYVSVASSTLIYVYTPAHAAGLVDVVVTNPNAQAATLTGGFTFLAPPTITSQPTATPDPAAVNQAVTFTVGASDPNGGTLTYLWNYGDGATGASATHTYTAAGTFTASVTVTSSAGSTVSSTVSVVVNAAAAPAGAASITGTSTQSVAFSVKTMKGAVKSKGGHDSVSVQGTLPNLSALFSPQGATLSLDVGGASSDFTLDAKGRGKSTHGTIALLFKLTKNKATKKSTFAGGNVPFKALLKNGAWSGVWANNGLDLTQPKTTFTLPATITLNGQPYIATLTVNYKGKQNVGGTMSGK